MNHTTLVHSKTMNNLNQKILWLLGLGHGKAVLELTQQTKRTHRLTRLVMWQYMSMNKFFTLWLAGFKPLQAWKID